MPRVTVILSSLNHAKYLAAAIESVLNQTFVDFELFIVDDASDDDSWDIIQGFTDSRMVAIRNPMRMRGVYGFNELIRNRAQGEFIAIHHSDDVWQLEKLEKQVTYLDAHSEIGAVFTWAQIIDENDITSPGEWFCPQNGTQGQWLKQLFLEQNHLNHPSAMLRKQCYFDVGVYRYGLAQTADAELWSRVLIKFPIHVIQERLTKHRLFSDKSNTSGDRVDVAIRLSNEWNLLRQNYLFISSFEDIVAIFPNLERFRNQKGFDNRFLLAIACLYECDQRNAWQLGLRWLFELLNDDSDRKKIDELYSFTYIDFIRLTAEFDVYFAEADNQIVNLKVILTKLENEHQRILNHIVFGRLLRFWRRFVNESIPAGD